MNSENFNLNNVFQKNAKVYQTRPVIATKYKPGMENAWVLYFSNGSYEGMKFFDTKEEAQDYVNANHTQFVEENGKLIEMEVEYELPIPVLCRKETEISKKIGFVNAINEKLAFKSNETNLYDFFLLEPMCGEDCEAWIIQEYDGNIRVWYDNDEYETFFGKENDLIYEKVEGKEEYIKVAV